MNYKEAGVNIDEANAFVQGIKSSLVPQTSELLLNNIGGFGAFIDVSFLKEYRHPVLVTSTDGIGGKIRLAIKHNKLGSLGQDLVAMCVNDIAVSGATPLFMLDYYATSKLNKDQARVFMDGLVTTCINNKILLVGGETAELPGFFKSDEIFDVAGFVVGVVEKETMLTSPHTPKYSYSKTAGALYLHDDILIGVASSGPHSNGYSFINKILEEHNIEEMELSTGQRLYEALLEPTLIYTDAIQVLLNNSIRPDGISIGPDGINPIKVRSAAHITGGGIAENLARIVPDGLAAHVFMSKWELPYGSDTDTWQLPEVFRILKKFGEIEDDEMLRVFNCGLGLILCISVHDKDCARIALAEAGYRSWEIGAMTERVATMKVVNFV